MALIIKESSDKYATCQFCGCDKKDVLFDLRGSNRSPSLVLTVCSACVKQAHKTIILEINKNAEL